MDLMDVKPPLLPPDVFLQIECSCVLHFHQFSLCLILRRLYKQLIGVQKKETRAESGIRMKNDQMVSVCLTLTLYCALYQLTETTVCRGSIGPIGFLSEV